MKTIKSTLLVIGLFMVSLSASAQFGIGPMLVYGWDTDLGVGFKAKFAATDEIQISPSFAFLSSTELLGIKATASELNADAHYSFNPGGTTEIYGLAGLNLVFSKISGGALIESESSTEIGLNVGLGAEFPITDSLLGFTQAKYTISELDQLGIHAGVYFTIGN